MTSVCSGQSNMERGFSAIVNHSEGKKLEDNIENFNKVRVLHIPNERSKTPLDNIPVTAFDGKNKKWIGAHEEGHMKVTGIGLAFGIKLYQQYGVPIGLIDSNKGGSMIEFWMHKEAMAKSGRVLGISWYNSMLYSLHNFPIKGAIWYQGESNTKSVEVATVYAKQFQEMIKDWRARWGLGTFPSSSFNWLLMKGKTNPI